MASALCPDCAQSIEFNPLPEVGQRLTCAHCASELEVIGEDPLELDWAYDWSWSDEEEEDG